MHLKRNVKMLYIYILEANILFLICKERTNVARKVQDLIRKDALALGVVLCMEILKGNQGAYQDQNYPLMQPPLSIYFR